jgi:hypothetical protein
MGVTIASASLAFVWTLLGIEDAASPLVIRYSSNLFMFSSMRSSNRCLSAISLSSSMDEYISQSSSLFTLYTASWRARSSSRALSIKLRTASI